ncbi:HvfC/BufC family peptide modification chaperone [Pseudomonas sp. KNUC1026]|uniref:HvfC/BufC family peptide modification chaperone n=1 Tax=Pseudomonas sp. KNUC1026 TaxID=2893890 RepID=UPI001F2F0BDA|nr:putative DNA-binding domain-containing protein [Pseudomonas sp. KNUC1026]UFH51195.1 DNA-binding domain-containing protein [Pseudomonas sp. KNUC1026]
MKSDLASFQDAFIAALFQRPAIGHEDVFEQPGFAVYRNSVSKACIDALQANYPAPSGWWALAGSAMRPISTWHTRYPLTAVWCCMVMALPTF